VKRSTLYNLGWLLLVAMLLGSMWFVACMRGPEVPIQAASIGHDISMEAYSAVMAGTGAGETTLTTQALRGELVAIYVDYTASITNTTDLTITYGSPVGGVIYEKIDSLTDAMVYPRASLVTNAAAAITDSHDRFPLAGPLTVKLGETTPGTTAVLYFVVER